MRNLALLWTIWMLAGCGGDEACRCTGALLGGQLDVACGHSACVGGFGYHCSAKGQAGPDALICGSSGGSDGGVTSCRGGDPCTFDDECHAGVTRCVGGSVTCVAGANRPNGTSCTGGVCESGRCSSCGDPCATEECNSGTFTCVGGVPSCENLQPVADGDPCSFSSGVCSGGVCSTSSSCVDGTPCAFNDCTDGAWNCDYNVCAAASAKPNGAPCGSGKVCDNSACIACADGAACITAACHNGTMACGSGVPACVDQGTQAADGAACNSYSVCKSGKCNACSSGIFCTPSDPCKYGTTSCATGASVCVPSSNKSDGTTCDADKVCHGGVCSACVANLPCTPTNPCHAGHTSCATGVSLCVDSNSNAADGTGCGDKLFCQGGVCDSCVPDAVCSTGDPCQTGGVSCATGRARCEPSGATAATSCGNVTKGTCANAACQCPAGTGYFNGDCQTCAAGVAGAQVNANPTVGHNDQCCGRTSTAGFGGPCRTITYAMGLGATSIGVAGDAQGNVSPLESYPLVLHGVSLVGSYYGAPCIPGESGKNVINVTSFATVRGLVIGRDCQGTSHGGADGIYVGNGASASLDVQIGGVQNGIHLDGGSVSTPSVQYWPNKIAISNVSGDGVLCRSETNTSATSTLGGTLSIVGAAGHDIRASRGCAVSLNGAQLGAPAPCPAAKLDDYGIYAEGNATVSLSSSLISCQKSDGVSLHANGGLSGTPTATISYTQISHAGCAGAFAETGALTLTNYNSLFANQWGAIQRSSASAPSSTTPVVKVNGSSLYCNGRGEPGACCPAGVCPSGADLFNNSGLALDAHGDSWEDSPVTVCNCNAALASCACTSGATTPPAGVDVLNAPLSAGTPTTDISTFTKIPSPPDCTTLH